MSQALLPPTRQMATTPSALDWLARVIAALTLLPQVVHQQRKSDGVGARALARDARTRETADGQAHARPRRQAIVIIRLRTTDDICDLPPASHRFPAAAGAHTHAHAHDIGAYRAILPSRLLPNPLVTVRSSSDISLHSTGYLTLTLSAPGKERRARALVESHGLTHMWWVFTAVTMFQGVSIPSSTRSRGSRPATKCLGVNNKQKQKRTRKE